MQLRGLWPWGKSPLKAINTLNFVARPVTGRQGMAIGAIIRDEAPFLREWLRFHEYAGVEQFYLYDDGSTDGGAAIARTVCTTAKVTVFPWSQRLHSPEKGASLNNQILAYGHCLANFGRLHRWMSLIDVDEFIVPLRDGSIPEALATLEHCKVIALPWAMFGTSGHDRRPEGPATRAYGMRLDPALPEGVRGLHNIKCIFDPMEVTRLHVHRIKAGGATAWNDRGVAFTMSPRSGRHLTAERLQLNHYYARSREDVEAKIAKGGGNYTSYAQRDRALLESRIGFIDANAIPDRRILDYIARKDAATGTDFYGALAQAR
jgi:hypothetical protein